MNFTHSILLATRPPQTMSFSGALTTASVYVTGPGTRAGDGYPLPRRGILTSLQIWDGTTLRSDTDEISFNANDRISLHAQSTGSDFTLRIRINGNSSNLQVPNIPFNSTIYATVEFLLIRD